MDGWMGAVKTIDAGIWSTVDSICCVFLQGGVEWSVRYVLFVTSLSCIDRILLVLVLVLVLSANRTTTLCGCIGGENNIRFAARTPKKLVQ